MISRNERYAESKHPANIINKRSFLNLADNNTISLKFSL